MNNLDKVFNDAGPVEASNSELYEIGAKVSRALVLMDEIDAMESQLKSLKAELNDLTEKQIPEVMDNANCGLFKHKETGRKVEVQDKVTASISKENRPEAHAWLRNAGHEDIIKNKVEFEVGRGKDNIAAEAIASLKQHFGIDAERTESVHAQTLGAFCREQLAAGVELPAALLGLWIRRVAVIK
jgi:hypothetical protein